MSGVGRSNDFYTELVDWRRTIHQQPELSNKEEKTSKYVQEHLTSLGIPFKIAYGTGIVAEIKGNRPGPSVGLRGDMDALPLQEENDVEYKSKIDGVMHACGHDAHTSMLMATAKLLKENNDFPGSVILVFQPSEELTPGGAKPMIDEGALEEYDLKAFFALHVAHSFPSGTVGMKYGFATAGVDALFIDIKGEGTHAAAPHLGDDVIFATSQFVSACQQIRARQVDSFEPHVFSLTSIRGGRATNILPDSIRILGTIRTSKKETRKWVHKRVKEIAEGVSMSTGCEVEVEIEQGYAPGYNDKEVVDVAKDAAKKIPEIKEFITDHQATMGAEDFFEFSFDGKIPVGMAFLGIKNEERGIVYPVHSPKFDIEEKSLPIGADLMAQVAVDLLEKYSK